MSSDGKNLPLLAKHGEGMPINFQFPRKGFSSNKVSQHTDRLTCFRTGMVKRLSRSGDAPTYDERAIASEVEKIIEEAEIRLNLLRFNGPSEWKDASGPRRRPSNNYSGHSRRLSNNNFSGHSRGFGDNYSGHSRDLSYNYNSGHSRRPSLQKQISLWNFGASATGRIALNQTAKGSVGTTAVSQARNVKATNPTDKGGGNDA